MATIAPADLVNLRTKTQRITPYLNFFQPALLLLATVDGAHARGAQSIAYTGGVSGSFGTIGVGQTLETDTATGTKRIRIKSIAGAAGAGTITVDENAIKWGAGDTIRILHYYDVWPIPPRIDGGVFYKYYNIPYSNQNSLPPPVAIAGPHRAGFLSAGSLAFQLDASDSYAIADGAAISTYAWTNIANGGGAGGTFNNANIVNPILTFTASGQYWLKLTVTDDNGQSQSTYRAIFVCDRTGANAPYIDFTVQNLSGDWQSGGWRFTLQATGDLDLTTIPGRALTVLWYEDIFDDTEGYVNLWGANTGKNIICNGYLRNDNNQDSFLQGTGQTSFEVTTLESVLDKISILGSVSLNATAIPAFWYQYASWLTVGRAIHHLLRWHSTLLDICDVYGFTDNVLGVENTEFAETSLLQMCNTLAWQRGHFAKMVSDRLGRIHLVTDSQMLNTTQRAALDTVYSIIETDISDVVTVVHSSDDKISNAEVSGFSFDGTTATPFISIAPGYRPASISYAMPEYRGVNTQLISFQVLADQTDSNEKSGRILAQANNEVREIRINHPSNYLGAYDIVPSIGFYVWAIPDADLKRGYELFGNNLICRNVTHAIDTLQGTMQTSANFETEALGPDGIVGNYPVGYPVPVTPDPPNNQGPTISDPLLMVDYDDIGTTYYAVYIGSNKSLSAEVTIEAGIIAYDVPQLVMLSPTVGLVVYRSDTNTIKAAVLSLSGSTITTNAPVDLGLTTDYQFIGLAKLTATTAILIYRDAAKLTRAVVITITGTIPSAGTPTAALSADLAYYGAITALSASVAVAVWFEKNGVNSDGQAMVLNISGNVITPAALSYNFNTDSAGTRFLSSLTISSSQAVAYYGNRSGNSKMQAVTLDVTGDVITPNIEADIFTSDATAGSQWFSSKPLVKINSSAFIAANGWAATLVGANIYDVQVVYCIISGANILPGTPTSLLPAPVSVVKNPAVAINKSLNKVTAVYSGALNIPTRTSVSISGATLVDDNDDTTGAITGIYYSLALIE